MKFEKLSEDKLKITFNISDLADNNINFQSFMANSTDTQQLFLDMLEKAEKEIGFVTRNYKIMIEALVTSTGEFIVVVTRSLPDAEAVPKKKFCKTKRKDLSFPKGKLIYSFNCFDDFCLFCNSLDKLILKNISKISKNITLYFLKNTYYLLIDNINSNEVYSKPFVNCISEFASCANNTNVIFYELSEYGKTIIKNNAIKTCLKYF